MCWRCGEPGEAVRIIRQAKHRSDGLDLCVPCLTEAMEALTGYRWTAQMEQWRSQSEAAEKAIRGGVESPRTRQRHMERASRRATQREVASG